MISEGGGAHAPYSASRNTALRRLRRPRGLLRKPRACAPPRRYRRSAQKQKRKHYPRFAALNRVRNIAKSTKAAKNGTFFCGSGFQFPRFLSHTAKRRCRYDSIKEALNKSWHASCLHIFRSFGQPLCRLRRHLPPPGEITFCTKTP